MLDSFKKVLLLSLVFVNSVYSISLQAHFLNRIVSSTPNRHQPQRLAKKVSSAWQQIGSTCYHNTATIGNSPEWVFESRDTVIFDAVGNAILAKTSSAKSGWEVGNLTSLDSSIYSGDNLMECVHLNYRTTDSYLEEKKAYVETNYNWNATKKNWVISSKDSLIFSQPLQKDFSRYNDLSNFVEAYFNEFDALGLSIESYTHIVKNEVESNATALVLEYYDSKSSINKSFDLKTTFVFKSTDWKESNIIEIISLEKDLSNGTYNTSRQLVTTTGVEYFYWDDLAKKYVCTSKLIDLQDSYGNDTLSFSCNFSTSTSKWDTTTLHHYVRSYDTNGNNTLTVSSTCDTSGHNWHIITKNINIFGQTSVPVSSLISVAAMRGISIIKEGTTVCFRASGITALKIYSATGRLITSKKQPASSSISLNLSEAETLIPTGVYFVQITGNDVKPFCKLSVLR